MFLAASPDICAGLILAHFWMRSGKFTPETGWAALFTYGYGVTWALVPDVSLIIYSVVRRQKLDSGHRDITHYPLPILSALGLLGFLTPWAWLAGLCITAHFLDDTTDPGGIAWLWPISKRKYQILATETGPLELEDWLERYFFQETHKSTMVITLLLITPIILLNF